jgi:putative ABC transport system permease protein
MPQLRETLHRLRSVLHRKRYEQELEEELRLHLELEIESNLAQGMTPQQARRAAAVSFGGVEQAKVECRDASGFRVFEELAGDARHGMRQLRMSPGFAAVATLTLALGIGSATTVFSVVNGVLVRRLPYPDSDRIMTLWNTYPGVDDSLQEVSPPDFFDWRSESRSFEHMAAYERFVWDMAGDPQPVRVRGARVSGDFFAVMAVPAMLGRPVLPADDHEGAHHVVVLSHRLWVERFGSDPSVLGRTVILTGVPHRIVGVMPTGFRFPDGVELWTPLAYEPPFPPSLRRSVWFRTVGRLRPGVTARQAGLEMAAIAQRLARRYPDTNEGRSVAVVSLLEHTVGGVRPALLMLLGAAGLVLLVACVNVANLMLVRAVGRRQEISLRAALGASRGRIVRQLGMESLVFQILGGLGGLGIAWLALEALRRTAGEAVPRMADIHIDLRAMLFAVLLSLVAGAASGMLPAMTVTGRRLFQAVQESGRRTADSRRHARWRQALVIAEVALAEVLLVGGLLLLQSYLHLRRVDLGFTSQGVLTSRFDLHSRRYADTASRRAFYRETVERVAAIPGVRSAALATTIPMHDVQMTLDFLIDGRPKPAGPVETPWAGYNSVTPDYFHLMGIRLLEGRLLTDGDGPGAPAVAVVNSEMARRYWPGTSPLGSTFRILSDDSTDAGPEITVVGVVDDVRQVSLTSTFRPELYLPYAQYPWKEGFLLVRSSTAPEVLAEAVRRELRKVDPDLALSDVRRMDDEISDSLGPPRFQTVLVGVFAAVALALALVGVFGVISYSVSRRSHEIAIRLALGARRRDVFTLVATSGARLVFAGVVLGIVLALLMVSGLSRLLFGVVPTQPAAYIVVGLLLSVVALAACSIPCLRAIRVDPAVALRWE